VIAHRISLIGKDLDELGIEEEVITPLDIKGKLFFDRRARAVSSGGGKPKMKRCAAGTSGFLLLDLSGGTQALCLL